MWAWQVAAAYQRRVRFHLPITVYCSWTNCRNSNAPLSKCCANHWKNEKGYYGHPTRKCSCSSRAVWWYRRKISGPLLDRIDLQIEAAPTPFKELMELNDPCDSSAIIRQRVTRARKKQLQRFRNQTIIHCNAQITDHLLAGYCKVEPHAMKFLLKSMDQYDLSFRAYSSILKVGRTIADLACSEWIEINNIAEAIHFRSLDKPLVINFQSKQKTIVKPVSHGNYQV